MIRINLQAVAKGKKGRRTAAAAAAAPEFAAEGPSRTTLIAVGAVLLIALNGGAFFWLDREARRIEKETKEADQKLAELKAIQTRVDQKSKLVQNYQNRVQLIDQLRSNQSGPVNLLDIIGSTVNTTEAVWLISMKDEGNSIAVEGSALSHDSVATLMENLKRSNLFDTIELKETVQDDKTKDRAIFQFTLTCNKKRPAGA